MTGLYLFAPNEMELHHAMQLVQVDNSQRTTTCQNGQAIECLPVVSSCTPFVVVTPFEVMPVYLSINLLAKIDPAFQVVSCEVISNLSFVLSCNSHSLLSLLYCLNIIIYIKIEDGRREQYGFYNEERAGSNYVNKLIDT